MRTIAAKTTIEDSEALSSVLREPLGLYVDDNETLVTEKTPMKDLLKAINSERDMMADIIDGLIDEAKSMRAQFEKDIERLKNHRHDTSKHYGGKPEL